MVWTQEMLDKELAFDEKILNLGSGSDSWEIRWEKEVEEDSQVSDLGN